MTTPADDLSTAALARNDRYLLEFVEALGMCPFARRCRESGKLVRRVLLDAGEALEAVRAIEALPRADVEVALLLCPNEPADGLASARAFEQRVTALRHELERAHAGDPPFYCVAFHPDLPRDLHDAHRAVPFIRRSPDPTIQLVNAEVLRAVRSGREGGSTYLDPRGLTLEQILALASPVGLADRISEANLETLERVGPDAVERLLTSFRER